MVDLPPGSVIITPNQMYAEMQDIGRKVDHLADIVDPAIAQLRTDITEVEKHVAVITAERKAAVEALDRRIRGLENWRWFVLGIAAVFGPAGGYALTVLFGGK
jgi:hypothetical protein